MAEFVKCSCANCGTNYRLPVEFQGRRAKCKKCGEKFEVPKNKTLEDSVLDWLSESEDSGREEASIAQPRVISIPKEAAGSPGRARRQGPIRIKTTAEEG